MLPDNVDDIKLRIPTLSSRDVAVYKKFMLNGKPGLNTIRLSDIEKMKDMYISGHSFHRISSCFRVPKGALVHLADQNDWYGQYMEKFEDSSNEMLQMMAIYRNETPSFYMELGTFVRKNIEKTIELYNKTKDPRLLDSMDKSLIDKIIKIDTFIKGDPKKEGSQGTSVNIFTTGETTVSQEKNVGSSEDSSDILKALADIKRKKQIQNSSK